MEVLPLFSQVLLTFTSVKRKLQHQFGCTDSQTLKQSYGSSQENGLCVWNVNGAISVWVG